MDAIFGMAGLAAITGTFGTVLKVLLVVLHVLVCLFLILVVLLQQGKGADLSAFAGGGSQTVFGARGATTLLHKLTTWSFVVFAVTSISLALLQTGSGSLLPDDEPGAKKKPAAASPAVTASPAPVTASPAPVAVNPVPAMKVTIPAERAAEAVATGTPVPAASPAPTSGN